MILCLGTTPAVQRVMVFDAFVAGRRNVAREVHVCAAGKSINAAKVLGALGEAVLAMTFTGGGSGNVVRRDLERLGVPAELVEVARPTRICVTAIGGAGGHITEFVEEAGAVTQDELAALWSRFMAAIEGARLLLLCGSLAPGVPDDFYQRCMIEANARGIPAIIDAQGEALRRALPCRPAVVKPNRAELAATMGMPAGSDIELHAAARRLIEMGPAWAVISSGGGPVLVCDGARFWRAATPPVAVVNPIGSGDALAGGLAAGLARGLPLPQAAAFSIACGVSNAAHLLPGQIDPEQVSRLAGQIELEPAGG